MFHGAKFGILFHLGAEYIRIELSILTKENLKFCSQKNVPMVL